MPITLNPVITTNAGGTFSTSLDGLMQGMAMDDPSIRFQLTGGQLAVTETLPMFGGIPIAETIPPVTNTRDRSLQNVIARAIANYTPGGGVGSMTGISVFNQNYAMVNSPQSPVPQASGGMLVNFYRFGSRARIAMNMDPAFNPAAGNGLISSELYWNTANQWITSTGAGGIGLPATTALIDYNIGNSMVVVYNAATGFATWNRLGNACLLEI
jgi:hypothetical protein